MKELDGILRVLARNGVVLPRPAKVEVIADEDFEGDPIFRLKLVFPANGAPEAASWKVVSPLLMKLLVFENGSGISAPRQMVMRWLPFR